MAAYNAETGEPVDDAGGVEPDFFDLLPDNAFLLAHIRIVQGIDEDGEVFFNCDWSEGVNRGTILGLLEQTKEFFNQTQRRADAESDS